jgi:hypothetical protein
MTVGTRIEIDTVERYPFYRVRFKDDPVEPGDLPVEPYIELPDADAADLREVRDRFRAWQARLGEIMDERRGGSGS